MKVRVVGEQFTWTFFYPGGSGGKEIASNQLYLPKGRAVRFDVQSKDVLHDFWVPAFRQKIDAVPGITTHIRVRPVSPARSRSSAPSCAGSATPSCARAPTWSPRSAFDKWLADMKTKAAGGGEPAGGGTAGGGAAPDGKALFATAPRPPAAPAARSPTRARRARSA